MELREPIGVLGGSGFIGGHLVKHLTGLGYDVSAPFRANVLREVSHRHYKTIFNCIGYGGYREHSNSEILSHDVNYLLLATILGMTDNDTTFINAGSSSEYGVYNGLIWENMSLYPDTHYGVSKAAASHLIYMYGKKGLRCAHLRLFHVYGPGEREARLIPTVIKHGLQGKLPPFVKNDVGHDFIYVSDVCRAFVAAAKGLPESLHGHSFNVGMGIKTTVHYVAGLAKDVFDIKEDAAFTIDNKAYAHPISYNGKINTALGFYPEVDFCDGFMKTVNWYRSVNTA